MKPNSMVIRKKKQIYFVGKRYLFPISFLSQNCFDYSKGIFSLELDF